MSEAPAKTKLDALDGLRGFAASFVMLHHLATNQLLPAHPLLMHGGLLVDTFFIISGFVMSYQYGDRLTDAGNVKTFIRRRFARVWPLHTAILLVMIVPRIVGLVLNGAENSELLKVDGDHSLGSWFASLTLVHGMGIYDYAVWNGPSWTISVEFFVYIIFAICALSNGRWLYRFAGVLLATTTVVLIVSRMYLSIPIEFSFLRCLFGFFCGVMMLPLYRATMRSKMLARRHVVIAEGVLVAAAVSLLWHSGKGPASLAFVPVCGLLTVVLATRRGLLAQLLTLRPMQALGAWSLGIYLLHIPVLNILMRGSSHLASFGLDFAAPGWGGRESFMFLSIVTVLAAFCHIYVEKPARSWLGGRAPLPEAADFTSSSLLSKGNRG